MTPRTATQNRTIRSDSDLIAGHLEGDTEAWEQLVDRYERFIYALIRRGNLPPADADDLFQNVCVKLYLHLEDLQDVQRLAGWIAAVVRQELVNHVRQTRKILATPTATIEAAPFSDLAEIASASPSAEATLLAAERTLAVRTALRGLPEPCRSLLTLLYGPDEVPYADAASRLGIPLGSIGPRRARCLERLKKKLELSAL